MRKTLFISILFVCPLLTTAQTQYTGGIGSGFNRSVLQNADLSIIDSSHCGGIGSGFTKHNPGPLNLSIIDSLHNGGPGSGFTKQTPGNLDLSLVDSVYNGSIGRGDVKSLLVSLNLGFCITDTITWNGNYSANWNLDANWDCGTVPGINSIVIIPSGKSRYPAIPVDVEIKTLLVRPGATVIVVTGRKLTINGQ